VAYKSTMESDTYAVLSPVIATVIPLFDGTNTFREIKESIFSIYNIKSVSCTEWSERIDKMFDSLMSIDDFLSTDGKVSASLQQPFHYFVPNFANYHYPSWRLERPLSVRIAFTNRCVCDCLYCFAERNHCEEMNIQQWIQIFDELAKNEIALVDIGGSDILEVMHMIFYRKWCLGSLRFSFQLKNIFLKKKRYDWQEWELVYGIFLLI